MEEEHTANGTTQEGEIRGNPTTKDERKILE